MHFTKPPLTITEKIALLKERGLLIPDETRAEKYLNHIGYFRLTGYFKYYQTAETNQFYGGISFDQVVDLYIFDRKLRLLVLDAIEKIEVSIKAQIDNVMSNKYGCFWYTDANNLRLKDSKAQEIYTNFIEIAKFKKENSTSMFGKAYREKYDEELFLPSRMLLEECMIGEVSNIYRLLTADDAKAVTQLYNTYYSDFQKRLQLLVHVRNISAHHSRLRNRIFFIKPRTIDVVFRNMYPMEISPNGKKEVIPNFFTFSLIMYYLLEQISP
jgi:abortive infection bacteriophage resistance protein